jgi:hypothetical protein
LKGEASKVKTSFWFKIGLAKKDPLSKIKTNLPFGAQAMILLRGVLLIEFDRKKCLVTSQNP